MSAVPTDTLNTADMHFSNVKYLAEYSAGKRFKIELAIQKN